MIFFITLFRYFTIVLFFTLHFFSFSQGMQTRERAHCARSVFPFIKKKKKKKKKKKIPAEPGQGTTAIHPVGRQQSHARNEPGRRAAEGWRRTRTSLGIQAGKKGIHPHRKKKQQRRQPEVPQPDTP